MVIASGLSLTLLLSIRLILGEAHFGGHSASLDFGPKYGIVGGESNIAFDNKFSTYGHCLQGFFSSSLHFPCILGLLSISTSACSSRFHRDTSGRWSLVFFLILASLFTLYPSYNFIKRICKHGETFASSSYMNNATEWALGFCVGLPVGFLITSWEKSTIYDHILNNSIPDEDGYADEAKDYQDLLYPCNIEDHTYPPAVTKVVKIVQVFLYSLLVCTVFGFGFAMGYTWNNCQEGATDCINYMPPPPPVYLIAIFLLIPTSVYIISLYSSMNHLNRFL